jgi:hypothetical protein
MRSASSSATSEKSIILFESLTAKQIRTAVLARDSNQTSYLEFYEYVKSTFANIRFIMDLCMGDAAQLQIVTKQCLLILASPVISQKIEYLIENNNSKNKDQKVPHILNDYRVLLREIQSKGGEEFHIFEVLMLNVVKISDAKLDDLNTLFLTLAEFSHDPKSLKLFFDTLIKQAETHPHLPISYLIAEESKGRLSYAHVEYQKWLQAFALKCFEKDKDFELDKVIRLFHFKDDNDMKPFYSYIKTSDKNAGDFVLKCEDELSRLIFRKIYRAALLPQEKFLLAHKELITRFITTKLSPSDRQKTIKMIFQEKNKPLSQYYWTARSFLNPSVNRGELKKLNMIYAFQSNSGGNTAVKQEAPRSTPAPSSSFFSSSTPKQPEIKRFEDKTLTPTL